MCEETLPEKSVLSHFSSKHRPYESGGSAATTNLLFKPDELSKGNIVFPPTVAQFNVGGGETFFVSCGRCPGDKNWYFWAYTMGGPSLADHFLVKMTVGQGANKFEWDSKVFPLDLSRQDVFAHAEAVGFSAKAVFQCMVGNPDVDSRGRGYANALKMGYEIKRKPL